MKKENQKKKDVDRKSLSFFMLGFPTLLIILIGLLNNSLVTMIQIVIAIYQFILLKQFLDNYY